jgi:CIC family chloride channel protein
MGAVVAATTQAPIAAILILFELTGDYKIILPLMTACILSTLVAGLLKRESIYTQKLLWKGVSLEHGREEGLLRSLSVRRLLAREFTSFHPDLELERVLSRALADRQEVYPVVDADGALQGLVRFEDLRAVVREEDALSQLVVAADVALPPVWLDLEDDLNTALRRFSEHEVRGLPVKSKQRLVGMIYERDVIALYSQELNKLELANAVMSRRSFREGGTGVDLGGGLRLDEVPTPPAFAGQTLRQADLRRRHGVEVLYLKRSQQRHQVFPAPDLVLEPSDRLVVMGEPSALQSLRRI